MFPQMIYNTRAALAQRRRLVLVQYRLFRIPRMHHATAIRGHSIDRLQVIAIGVGDSFNARLRSSVRYVNDFVRGEIWEIST